jgi:hypothetical protein
MKRWSSLLVAALLAASVFADDTTDDTTRDAKEAAAAPGAQAPVAQAPGADAAVATLEKAMRVDPKAALQLGRLRESRGEFLDAEDAYRTAAAALTGIEKGEAFGRMAVLQDARGATDAAASAEAAMAADPEGLWPTIAVS